MKNQFEIRGETTAIFINCKGEVIETLIDTEDLSRVQEFPYTWCCVVKKNAPYVFGNIKVSTNKWKSVYLARLIMNEPEGLVVDHKNPKKTLDNRKKNLRTLTFQDNLCNKHALKTSKSGVRGVYFDNYYGKWRGKINYNGKLIWSKTFSSLKVGKVAIKIARKKLMPVSTI